jgi:hypothetical protein
VYFPPLPTMLMRITATVAEVTPDMHRTWEENSLQVEYLEVTSNCNWYIK